MNKKSLVVYKDNRVVEAGYKLNKIEQNIILYSVAKLNPLDQYLDIRINVKEFAKMFNLNEKSAYNQLKTAIDELYNRTIKVKDPIGDEEFRWIYAKRYFVDEGSLSVSFTPTIAPYLKDLKSKFTCYNLANVCKFKKEYSFRFYEFFIQYLKIGVREISIDELKRILLLDDKYQETKYLNDQLIKPCVAEINKYSNLNITYETIKKGRSIVAYKFKIKSNNQKQVDDKAIKKSALKDVLNTAQISAKVEAEKEKIINTESYEIYEKILITFANFSNSNITLSEKEINLLNKFKRMYEKEKEIKFSSEKQKKYLLGLLDKKNSIQQTTEIQIRSRQKTLKDLKKISDDIELKVGMILIGSVTKNEYTIQDNLIIIGASYTRATQDNLSLGVNDLVHIRELIDAKKLILKK